MGKYSLNLSEKAIKDLKAIHKSGDKNSIQKVEKFSMNFLKLLLKELEDLNF